MGCEGLVFDSDAYWECCIRRHAGSLQHQVNYLNDLAKKKIIKI